MRTIVLVLLALAEISLTSADADAAKKGNAAFNKITCGHPGPPLPLLRLVFV